MKARGIQPKAENASPGLKPTVSKVLEKKKLEEQVYLKSKLKYQQQMHLLHILSDSRNVGSK